jgi:hypothetical protein
MRWYSQACEGASQRAARGAVPVAVECPFCAHEIRLENPRPGRFATTCPKCRSKLVLRVPADRSKLPTVAAPKPERADHDAGHWPTGRPAVENAGVSETPHDGPRPPAAPAEAPSTRAGHVDRGDRTGEPAARPRPARRPSGVPLILGGYWIIEELGRGGLGAVYRARQISLGRDVALRVIKPELASNPPFLARFTREAYAAAQLAHPNLVRILDLGEDRGTIFLSMEFVEGQTLGQLLRERGKLDPEAAAGYVLQAARGLKSAHEQGMIHRDIKPDNLLLDRHGVVKVADLGLVKSPELARELDPLDAGASAASDPDRTRATIATGTPAFMAPEQGRGAALVDARADIYSLGCTLHELVTGRPPFEGRTALEATSRHQSEPIAPPDVVVPREPKALSEIILRMVAGRPADRFQELGEVIQALESFLGVASAGPFMPRKEDAEQLERAVMAYNDAPMAWWKPRVIAGFLGFCGLMVVLNLLRGWPILAGGFLGLAVLTVLAYFLVDGLARGPILFVKVRELVLDSRPVDWLTGLAAAVLLVAVLVVFQLQWVWLAFCVAAVLLAVAMRTSVDQPIEAQRRPALAAAAALMKRLRLQGVDEESLRRFVCTHAGDRWEPFFEDLFGYEAKREARERWGQGERGRRRPRSGIWREPIVAWIDGKQRARKEARERALLQKIEERSLCAKAENLVVARRKARRAADAMVAMAAVIKAAPVGGKSDRPTAQAIRDAARQPEKVLVEHEKGRLSGPREHGLIHKLFGPRARFLLGTALIAGFLAWMNQNGLVARIHIEQIAQQARQAAATQDVEAIRRAGRQAASQIRSSLRRQEPTEPLRLPGLPVSICRLFDGFGPGAAGLILLLSAFVRGARIGLFALPAALIAALGPRLGVPSIGPLSASLVSMGVGAGLLLLGFLFGRSRH